MATGEPVPISALKHDPAWKHVQMFKNGDRVQLKCIYCLKLFSGGGIHRIKEHLACQKGNASCCSRVPSDVRRIMLQSLEGVVVKKKKKQKLAEEISSLTPPTTNGLDSFGSPQSCDLNTGLELHHATPNMVEPISSGFTRRVEGMKTKSSDRRKRGRLENSSPSPVTPDTGAIAISNLSMPTTTTSFEKDQVHMAIGRFFYDAGVPLDAVNSPYFQPMIDAISSKGLGLEATSYHDLRGWVLKNSVEEMNGVLDRYKSSWGRTGCSIMVDEWTTETGRILINILVYCSEGIMFLKSFDVSDVIHSVDTLYELLKEVVEEVGVRNVVQVITDSAEHYVVVGKRLTETFRTLYWTPCAARSINLILEDFGKIEWIDATLNHAKLITRFIYNHGAVLNRMRRYTGGKDLVQPTITRSATDFISLKNMLSLKDNLQAMVISQEWMDCPFTKKPEGNRVIDFIFTQSFWTSCATIVRLTDPLMRVLRMVGSDKRPAMGYILAEMYHVKEAIKKELVEKKNYKVYWNIIDGRWDQQLQTPLHEAGFFLNPKFFYNLEGDVHDKIPSGMLDCIERLVPDINVQDKINRELISYKNAVGDFGRKMAIRARHTLLPAEWWSTYGGDCPNLARLAIRILSQICSASGCKRNSIPFEQIHKTKNHIEHQRLCDLVFVQYNLRLQQIQHQKDNEPGPMDPISTESYDIAEGWVAEKKEFFFGDGDSDWMVLGPPVSNSMPLESLNDNPDVMIAGFKYQDKRNGVGDDEEDSSQRM